MLRRGVLGLVAAALAALLALVVTRHVDDGQKADCEKVQVMASYNRWFQEGHASLADKNTPNSIDEYREWAAELHRDAGDIKDADLKARAESLAEVADYYVESVVKLRADLPAAIDNRPTSSRSWHEASRIGHQLNDAVFALTDVCPVA